MPVLVTVPAVPAPAGAGDDEPVGVTSSVPVQATATANAQILDDDELRSIQAAREGFLRRLHQPGQN